MSTLTEKTLGQSQIATGSQTTIVTATATDIIKTIFIVNTTATDATIEMWLVPNGDSVGDANKLLDDYTIPANDFMQISTYMPMETTGDTLQAEASAATTLTVNVFGASIT